MHGVRLGEHQIELVAVSYAGVIGVQATVVAGDSIRVEAHMQVPACSKPDFPRLTATAQIDDPLANTQVDTHFVRVECEPFGLPVHRYYLPIIRRE